MLAILIFSSLALIFFLIAKPDIDWRRTGVKAAIAWGVVITIITELLSWLKLFEFNTLLMTWCIINAWLVFRLLRKKHRKSGFHYRFWATSSPFLKFLVGGIVFIVVWIGFIALIAPPNNWDSMTYHLGRVIHWIQNQSVDHYTTHIIRQLYSGPWAGYLVTQLQILSGGDRFANLVQWLSMVGSVIGVSLLAQQLGARLRGQVFAAVVCATIPMGILQGSSTQTDYVVAFWLVCFVSLALRVIQDQFPLSEIPPLAASLGLALLAKGTAYAYALPFCLWLLLAGVLYLRWQIWKPLLLGGTITLGLNVGYYWRNWMVFGSVFGESSGQGNEVLTLPLLVSNLIRNLALHLSTPVRSVNLMTIKFVTQIHNWIGVDVNDPRITSPPGQNFDLHSLINHEDLAGNFLHLLLFLATTVYFLSYTKRYPRRGLLVGYGSAVVMGFVLFCTLVAWSPWRSRLHLPLFVLAAAFIGVVLARVALPKLANTLIILLLISSLLWVFLNETRPLLANSKFVEENRVENIFNTSRTQQYFTAKPELEQPYREAVEFVSSQSCHQIGLSVGGDTWEYPLWVLLQQNLQPVTIQHINVDNNSRLKAKQQTLPCLILASDTPLKQAPQIETANQKYIQRWSNPAISIFSKHEIATN